MIAADKPPPPPSRPPTLNGHTLRDSIVLLHIRLHLGPVEYEIRGCMDEAEPMASCCLSDISRSTIVDLERSVFFLGALHVGVGGGVDHQCSLGVSERSDNHALAPALSVLLRELGEHGINSTGVADVELGSSIGMAANIQFLARRSNGPAQHPGCPC
jgi:hypothetical protein